MSFDSDASFVDLDKAIGPREEVERTVCGQRVHITGIARNKKNAGLEGDGPNRFCIRIFEFKWQEPIVGRRVKVNGCLSRFWKQVPSPEPPVTTLPSVRNVLPGVPMGFSYCLEDVRYELIAE